MGGEYANYGAMFATIMVDAREALELMRRLALVGVACFADARRQTRMF